MHETRSTTQWYHSSVQCHSIYTIVYCCFRENYLKSVFPCIDVEDQSLILQSPYPQRMNEFNIWIIIKNFTGMQTTLVSPSFWLERSSGYGSMVTLSSNSCILRLSYSEDKAISCEPINSEHCNASDCMYSKISSSIRALFSRFFSNVVLKPEWTHDWSDGMIILPVWLPSTPFLKSFGNF